jgi:hypothetical protein
MKTVWIHVLILICLFASCNSTNNHSYTYQSPEQTRDGIEVGTLEEVKLDTNGIVKAVKRIQGGRFGEVHSMLIYKDGKLVLEEYFPGHKYQWDAPGHHAELIDWNRDSLHSAHSVSKSITSICVGMAIDKGFINNVHDSIFDYLPDHRHLKTEENRHITIEHLLTGIQPTDGVVRK